MIATQLTIVSDNSISLANGHWPVTTCNFQLVTRQSIFTVQYKVSARVRAANGANRAIARAETEPQLEPD